MTITSPQHTDVSPLDLLRMLRTKQWAKNLLLLGAPLAAGLLLRPEVITRVAVAFVAFSAVASAGYIVNDLRDRGLDASHPQKRHRPVAAGLVSLRLALGVAVVLLAIGLAAGAAVDPVFLLVLVTYLAVTFGYSLGLKRVAVLDIALVASGFILRAIAGGAATSVAISKWFLIVASFGSLFVVVGKRYAEHISAGSSRGSQRQTLDAYPLSYLRSVWEIAAAVALTAYCLWAFEQAEARGALPFYVLTIIPFSLALLRYVLLLERGRGGQPEDLLLGDVGVGVAAAAWVAMFVFAVYVAR